MLNVAPEARRQSTGREIVAVTVTACAIRSSRCSSPSENKDPVAALIQRCEAPVHSVNLLAMWIARAGRTFDLETRILLTIVVSLTFLLFRPFRVGQHTPKDLASHDGKWHDAVERVVASQMIGRCCDTAATFDHFDPLCTRTLPSTGNWTSSNDPSYLSGSIHDFSRPLGERNSRPSVPMGAPIPKSCGRPPSRHVLLAPM